jgi:hypothetical protein
MKSLFRRLFRAAPARPATRTERRLRPEVESLEDRRLMTVTPHGGAILPHVEVQGLYIGDQWGNNATLNSQANYFEGFLNSIVHSSYMDALTNAGYGVGRGSFTPGKISYASLASGSTLDDGTIRSWLDYYVGHGVLQAADANTLYVCFVEPNVLVRQGDGSTSTGFRGYHTAFYGSSGLVRYAVIAYPGGATGNSGVSFLSSVNSMTKSASHEIAEAATDPDIGYSTKGWYDDTNNGEIGDINNDRVMYVNGYAMQRVINQHDFNMTPSQATSDRAVNFVLQSNGNVVEVTSAGATALAGSMVALSDQGIDNQGHAMVDVVDKYGNAWEFHDVGGSGSWTYLGGGIKSAKAGQGVSYILYTSGSIYEFDDATGKASYVYSSGSRIDAGTDGQGVNAVDVVFTWGDGWEHSDDSGWHFIASYVQSLSAGLQGISDYVTTSGVAHWHTEGGSDTILGYGVAQVTAGTDQNGNYMIDMLYTSGDLYEYRYGGSWTWLDNGVVSVGKGHNGVVDMAFSWGDAWAHDSSGWHYLAGSAVTAA